MQPKMDGGPSKLFFGLSGADLRVSLRGMLS